jgi:hypothetical protein
MKCWEDLEWLHIWRLFKKGLAPWIRKYVSSLWYTFSKL